MNFTRIFLAPVVSRASTQHSWSGVFYAVFCFIAVSAQADPTFQFSEMIAPQSTTDEVFYQVDYQVDCRGKLSEGLPGLAGRIVVAETLPKTIRFDLFQGKHQTLITLGPGNAFAGGKVFIRAHKNAQCKIEFIRTQLVYHDLSRADFDQNIHLTAVKHSPFLVVRADQYHNRATDVPLELTYCVWDNPKENTVTLKYTYFFSDEDSKVNGTQVDEQMSRYGRMTDIEWIYEVVLDKQTGEKKRAQYQGGVEKKLYYLQFSGDHSNIPMKGQYWPHSSHPILYNVANNNVFSDTPQSEAQHRYIAYHPALSLEHQILLPRAREQFQISDQGIYMYLVSEIEIRNEKKLPAAPSEYLYFLVSGTLTPDQTPFNISNGAFKIEVTLVDTFNKVIFRNKSIQSVDRFGEDLFGQSSIAAVQVPATYLNRLREGELLLNIELHDARRWFKSQGIQISSIEPFILSWDEELGRYKKSTIPTLHRHSSATVKLL